MLKLLKRFVAEPEDSVTKTEKPLKKWHRQQQELSQTMPQRTKAEKGEYIKARKALDEAFYNSPEFAALKELWAAELRIRDAEQCKYMATAPRSEPLRSSKRK